MSDTHKRTPAPRDEIEFIKWIRAQYTDTQNIPIGIGDDCAGLRLPAGKVTLVTTDMLVAGVHFLPEEATPRQIGHKAIARGLSDIAAMAGEAVAVVVALAAPKNTPSEYLRELFTGMKTAADALDVSIIGGDIATGDLPLTLTVTAFGTGTEGYIALRSGARTGDQIMVTGELGGSLLGKHLSFLPRLDEAIWLREAVSLHAMIDISDGLSTDAAHISEESGVAIELRAEAIPLSDAARRMAGQSGRTTLEHALHDGEDYKLLFAISPEDAQALMQRSDIPVPVTCIGEAVSGSGVWIRDEGGRRRPLESGGWVHGF